MKASEPDVTLGSHCWLPVTVHVVLPASVAGYGEAAVAQMGCHGSIRLGVNEALQLRQSAYKGAEGTGFLVPRGRRCIAVTASYFFPAAQPD